MRGEPLRVLRETMGASWTIAGCAGKLARIGDCQATKRPGHWPLALAVQYQKQQQQQQQQQQTVTSKRRRSKVDLSQVPCPPCPPCPMRCDKPERDDRPSQSRRVEGRGTPGTPSLHAHYLLILSKRSYPNIGIPCMTCEKCEKVYAAVHRSSIVSHDIFRAFSPVPLVLFLPLDITLELSISVVPFYVSGCGKRKAHALACIACSHSRVWPLCVDCSRVSIAYISI